MQFEITGTIVLYKNSTDILLNTIRSFLNTELSVKLYLIDNSPTNELKDIALDPRLEYIHNPSNPGFGAAHNLAIKKVLDNSNYHLILNPDNVDENTTLDDFKSIVKNKNIPWQHDTSDYDDKLNKVGVLSMVSNIEINNDNSDY